MGSLVLFVGEINDWGFIRCPIASFAINLIPSPVRRNLPIRLVSVIILSPAVRAPPGIIPLVKSSITPLILLSGFSSTPGSVLVIKGALSP